jgi:UDP-glucose 4-epimerase
MPVLVTGGAGYVGSHLAIGLLERGNDVVVLDNLSTGLASLVPQGAIFVRGELTDVALIKSLIKDNRIDSVMHLAASALVPESVQMPLDYYTNNTASSLCLIQSCVESGVRNFIRNFLV